MRLPLLLTALVLLAAPARAADPSACRVAQLAAAPGARARPATSRPATPDADALAAAAPRLAALGLRVDRTLLDGLAAPPAAARGVLDMGGFAPARVVLLAAGDSATAATAALTVAAEGLVDWIEPLVTREALAASPASASLLDSLPDDPLLRARSQWGLWNVGSAGGGTFGGSARADVHAPEAWALGVGSDDVRLAVADTGIDPDQPELGGLLADGTPRIVDAINVTGEAVPAVTDSFGHGTLVAGVMAARTNDGPRLANSGVAGVCGGDGLTTAGCRIVPIKIAPGHSGEATSFDIARAVLHATDHGARAMNLSFAGGSPSRLERMAFTYAITRGCVVVVAAGNGGARPGADLPVYPAAYSAEGLCIQVGASDAFDQRAAFSSYGPGLDLLAPGLNIYTTFMTYPSWAGAVYDGYVAASGTSYAAPFVTGAVGLLAAARPELTDTDFQHLLRETADDVGDPGVDARTGWGRLDLARALDAVRPGNGIWHDEVAAQSFAPDTTAAPLALGEAGPGTLDRWSGTVAATRWAALATVALPDSFADMDSLRVWPRVGGTFAARGDYRLPWFTPTAQVVATSRRSFTLRGWIYRASDDDTCSACPEPWIPLPPEYVRFGFTVIGPVTRDSTRGVTEGPAPEGLVTGANPFRGSIALRAPGAGRIVVVDAGGRVLRAFAVGAGSTRWDGRDDAGRAAPPGLYFVRWSGARGTRTARIVKLDR
jgi:subtilisin family serine protease